MSSYTFRVDKELRDQAFAVFESYGLKPAQAIKLFFRQVAETKTVPIQLDYQPSGFNFDLARMKEQVNDTFHKAPREIQSVDELRQWLGKIANEN